MRDKAPTRGKWGTHMDSLRGGFSGHNEVGAEATDYDSNHDEPSREVPPLAIGQDERRMQVRAYNFWASLLDSRSFPSIEELDPENLPDFGPFSVLLDFTSGIEDPAVAFLGEKLAAECGAPGTIKTLTDVPSRSLLSRITDHYLQIIANQAPIGFEAEFVNQRGATIMYRGILLPFSSDDDTIDFIYGVINWKELADQKTTDDLLLEIEQSLDVEAVSDDDADTASIEATADDDVFELVDPLEAIDGEDLGDTTWPAPAADPDRVEPTYGSLLPKDWDGPETLEFVDDEDEDYFAQPQEAVAQHVEPIDPVEAIADFHLADDVVSAEGHDADDFDEEEDMNEGEIDPVMAKYLSDRDPIEVADIDFAEPLDLVDPVEPYDLLVPAEPLELDLSTAIDTFEDSEPVEPAPPVEALAHADELDLTADLELANQPDGDNADFSADFAAPTVEAYTPREIVLPETAEFDPGAMELADWLASARELALAADDCEDRSRQALYDAVGRAYDFSLAAAGDPEGLAELLVDAGIAAQDRAPLTPLVKLVFGAGYDKTRLAEYAAALAYGQRQGIAQGQFADYLAKAPGGLKGIVQAERRARKGETVGAAVAPRTEPRPALVRKLRKLEHHSLSDVATDGSEFTLLVARRLPDGEVVLLGEVADDMALLEKAARKLIS